MLRWASYVRLADLTYRKREDKLPGTVLTSDTTVATINAAKGTPKGEMAEAQCVGHLCDALASLAALAGCLAGWRLKSERRGYTISSAFSILDHGVFPKALGGF